MDLARVEESAKELRATLRKNEIGNYYKEAVWGLLREEEQKVLGLVFRGNEKGMAEGEIPGELEEALANMEHFGLVANREGRLYLTARLFGAWLERLIG